MTRPIVAFIAVVVCATLLVIDFVRSTQPSVSLLCTIGAIATTFAVVGWRGAMGQLTGISHVVLAAVAGGVSAVAIAFVRGVHIGTSQGELATLSGPDAAREISLYALLAAVVLAILWWAVLTSPGIYTPPRQPPRGRRPRRPRGR